MPRRMPPLEEPITFPVAAHAIGWAPSSSGSFEAAGRRLRRLILRREHETKSVIALRDRRGDPRWITRRNLHQFFPELRETKTDALARELRGYVEQVDFRVRRMVGDEVERRIGPLERDLRRALAELRTRGAA